MRIWEIQIWALVALLGVFLKVFTGLICVILYIGVPFRVLCIRLPYCFGDPNLENYPYEALGFIAVRYEALYGASDEKVGGIE